MHCLTGLTGSSTQVVAKVGIGLLVWATRVLRERSLEHVPHLLCVDAYFPVDLAIF